MATCAIEKHSEENVVQQLNELFGNVLHLDVIKTVAVSCHYDVIESSNKLLEITSYSENKISEMENKNKPETILSFKDIAMKCPIAPRSTSSNVISAPPKKSRKSMDIERAIKYIQKGYKVLIILRGVPGCGKSHLARRILESTIGLGANYVYHVLSTDDYFSQNGSYQYDPNQVSDAHGWNHNRAFHVLSRGFSPVIIDNTNTQMWEMKPYAMMATDYGYIIEILEPDTHWCSNDKELVKRNLHGVSKAKIKEMLERYEKNITPQKLLNAYNLSYRLQKPPQLRLYPPPNINISNLDTVSVNSQTNVNFNNNNECLLKSNGVSALNCQTTQNTNEPIETINLMDFTDDDISAKSRPAVNISNNEVRVNSWSENPVDEILMCTDDSTNTNCDVLKPSQQEEIPVITVDSSDEESSTPPQGRNLFPDIESAWGVNENALRSWDIVAPIKDEGNGPTSSPRQTVMEHKLITADSSCNTEDEYFQFLRTNKLIDNCKMVDVKILTTLNHDINRLTPKRELAVLKKPMHDKSCLTEDIYEDYDNHMSQLINLFPSVPKTHLKYWYNKCKGDLEWTIEFLLEAKEEITTLIEDNNIVDEKIEMITNDYDSDSSNTSQSESVAEGTKPKRSRKSSDEYKDLKKLIESKVDINDEHYSSRLLKIKQMKFGNGKGTTDNTMPSTSCNLQTINSPCSSPYEPKSGISKVEKCAADSGEVIVVDSDIEFDELDVIEDSSDKFEQKVDEMVELNLGEIFVSQLELKFGDPNMSYPKGFQPVVQVPVTLARQLYTFYIESVYQQMETQKQVLETLVKEDEEFARKLQAKEDENAAVQVISVPNFKEIMDEQVAQGIYQKEVDKWKNLNPDNLAARLTREKLVSVFPTIEENILIEILYAHGNKYQETVETLLASTGPENVVGSPDKIMEPPLKDEVVAEMKEEQKNCVSKEYEEQREARFYREEANKYLKKRADLYQKAQQYHQRGLTEVAQFYSSLASQQTIYFERANSLAATAFLDEHAKRLQDFNTLDLHFLYVKEAIPALDVFLDRNINLLRLSNNKQSEYLQIITGRGKRSENGVSKIKPVVIARLKRRKIKFVQLNPGLLKVKIIKMSPVTSEIISE